MIVHMTTERLIFIGPDIAAAELTDVRDVALTLGRVLVSIGAYDAWVFELAEPTRFNIEVAAARRMCTD